MAEGSDPTAAAPAIQSAGAPHVAAAAQPQLSGTANSLGLPPWAFGLLSIVGVVAGGGGAGFFGGSQAAKDIEALEKKVDKLDEKMDALREAIIRAHPEIP